MKIKNKTTLIKQKLKYKIYLINNKKNVYLKATANGSSNNKIKRQHNKKKIFYK